MRRMVTLTLAGLLAAPAGLRAQVCLGYPAGRGQAEAGAVVRLRSGLEQFGGTIAGHAPADVVGEAGATLDHHDGGAGVGFTVAGRAGLELHAPALPPALSLCPFAGAAVAHASGVSVLEAPLGIALGTVLPLDAGVTDSAALDGAVPAGHQALLLHGAPTLFLAHTSVPGASHSSVVGGLELGARWLYGRMYAGAAMLVRAGGNNAVFSLYAGLPLPGGAP